MHRVIVSSRVLLLACTVTMIFMSAEAQAAEPYVAVQGGMIRGKDNDVDELVDYRTTQMPAAPLVPSAEEDQEYDDVFSTNYGKGYDVGLIGGYDFGWFRLELELAHKRTGLRNIDPDDNADGFLTSLNAALNRPSEVPDPGAPGMAAATINDFDLDGHVSVNSAMVNAMLDIGVTKRLSAIWGYGVGRSWVRGLGDSDSAWGWQRFYGLRYKVSDKVELGVKYRKHTSGIIKLQAAPRQLSGNPDRLTVPGPTGGNIAVDRTTNAVVVQEIEGEFRTHSWSGSLFYNF